MIHKLTSKTTKEEKPYTTHSVKSQEDNTVMQSFMHSKYLISSPSDEQILESDPHVSVNAVEEP